MVEISDKLSVDGFENKEEFDKWLKEQEEKEPNENVLKTFKWFLIQVEQADKSKPANIQDFNSLDKYAAKVIDRKLMTADKVMKYIAQAMQ